MNHISGRRLHAVGVIAASMLALSACSDQSTGTAMPEPSTKSTSGGQPLVLEVLDYGEGDRSLFVLGVADGDLVTTKTTVSARDVIGYGRTRPIRVDSTMTSEVVDVTADEVKVRTTVTDIALRPTGFPARDVRGFEAELERYEGLTAVTDYAPNGEVVDSSVSMGASPRYVIFNRLIEHIGAGGPAGRVVFPTEPIGVGASWRAPLTIQGGNVPARLQATYTLVSWDGTSYRVRVRLLGGAEVTSEEDDGKLAIGIYGTSQVRGTTGSVVPSDTRVKLTYETDGVIGGDYQQADSLLETVASTAP